MDLGFYVQLFLSTFALRNGYCIVFWIFDQTHEKLKLRINALDKKKENFGDTSSEMLTLISHTIQHTVLVLEKFLSKIEKITLELFGIAIDLQFPSVKLLLKQGNISKLV